MTLNHQSSRPRHLQPFFPLPPMRTIMTPVLVMIMMMTMLAVSLVEAQETQSTCGAATRLFSKTTYVTCNFMTDISSFGFNVQFYPGEGKPAETALACNRQKSNGLNCHMGRGVQFDENQEVRHRLSFRRNESMNIPGSQYQCQVVSAPGNAERCTLAQIDIPIPERERETASTQPPNPNAGDLEINDRSFPIVVFLLILVIFAIVAAVGIMAYNNQQGIKERLNTGRWSRPKQATSDVDQEQGIEEADNTVGSPQHAVDGGTEKIEERQPMIQQQVSQEASGEQATPEQTEETYHDSVEELETDDKKILAYLKEKLKGRMEDAEKKIKDREKEAVGQPEAVKKIMKDVTHYARGVAAREVKLQAAEKALKIVQKAEADAKGKEKKEAAKILEDAKHLADKIHKAAEDISKEKEK